MSQMNLRNIARCSTFISILFVTTISFGEPISTEVVEESISTPRTKEKKQSQEQYKSIRETPGDDQVASKVKAAPVEPSAMMLEPGEALHLSTLPDTGFLNGTYSIDDQGFAHFPVVGMIKVSGIAIPKLQEKLKEEFIDYLRYPTLTVKPLIRVSLMGGFARPGLYYISPQANLWEAVRIGGGVQRRDGIEKMKWKRDRELVTKDLVPYFQSGKSLSSIGFESGDQLQLINRPEKTGWEIFKGDVLPMITFVLSTASSAATVYFAYDAIRDNR